MAGLLLDALLFLVVALYVPIGALRGGLRETLLGGAILLGAAIATAWAPAWGDPLADGLSMSEPGGRFLVAVAILLVVGLGLGYGAGAVAGRRPPAPESRIAGGLIGGVNALLLLSTLLAFLTDFLHEGETNSTVEDGWFAEALTERRGWVLLLAALVAAGFAAAVRLAVRFEDDLIEQPTSWGAQPATPRRRLAVGPPADPEGGKVEPDRIPAAASAIRRATRPVMPGFRRAASAQDVPGPARDEFGSGNGRDRGIAGADVPLAPERTGTAVVDDWLRRAAAQGGARADEAPAGPPAGDGGENEHGSTPFSFTGATLSSLLDPHAKRDHYQGPRVDPLSGLMPPVESEEDGPAGGADGGAERSGGEGLDPMRRCRICGTPAVAGLSECPFCGADL